MLAIEEVLVHVDERDHLLQNLQMRHANQSLQNVQEVHVVALRLELHVVVRTDFGEREQAQLRQWRDVVDRHTELAIVQNRLDDATLLQHVEEGVALSTG